MDRFTGFRYCVTNTLHDWRDEEDNSVNCGLRIIHYASERLVADMVFLGVIVRHGEKPVQLPRDSLMNFILQSLESCEVAHNTRFNTNLAGYRTLVSDIANAIVNYQGD